MKKIFIIQFLLIKVVFGYINIYPSFLYENLTNKGIFKTFTLTNRSDEKIKYRLYLEDKQSKDIKIEVYPKSITLSPFEKKEFKVLITKDKNKELNEEFSEKLVIKEVELPKQNKKIMTMLKLKLSGFQGNLKPKLKIEKLLEDKIKISNIGTRTGLYEIFDKNDQFIDSFILKKGEHKEFPLEFKNYIFKEKFNNKGEEQ